MIVSREVVRHRSTKLINQTDFLKACRVVVTLDLHLNIVRDIHRHATCLAFSWSSKQRTLVHAILHQRHITFSICLLVGIPETIATGTEVWCIAEADCWREDVTDTVNLLTKNLAIGNIEAIDLC